MIKWILLFAFTCMLTSCAVHNSMYAWCDYKTALARYTERPNTPNKTGLEASILRVISKSLKQKKKVPPGIYLQYGYLISTDGNPSMARQYFEIEKNAYPESATLVTELELKLKF